MSDTLGPKLRGWLKHFRARYPVTETDKRTLEEIFAEVLAKHEAARSFPAVGIIDTSEPMSPEQLSQTIGQLRHDGAPSLADAVLLLYHAHRKIVRSVPAPFPGAEP